MKIKKPILIVLGEPNSVFIEILSKVVNKKSVKKKMNYPIILIGSHDLIISQLKILKRNKVKYVFLPTYNQIFNFRTIKPIYLSKFAKQLCGKYRPGHFKGVINVVNRFLEIISPKYIFLGEKDYQQLILIKEHIKKNNIKTKVIPCKTIREVNGLACSSRNKSLSKSQFNLAGIVFKTIKKMMGKNSLKEIKFQLNKLGIKKIDYIEKIKIKNETRLFIAYYIRQTRLIDNIKLN